MIGYIKAFKPEMTFREFETYKAVYCSLCKTLGRKYGVLSRLMLSYDFTFLSIIYMSLSGERAEYETRKCVCNPLKKCSFCVSGETERDFAAAVTVMLCEYKIRDNIEDEGFFKALPFRVIYPYFKKRRKKAAALYPTLAGAVDEYKLSQREVQEHFSGSVDAAAEPSAVAIGKIFEMCSAEPSLKRVLYRFGYCLGKWIYLLDAGEDLKEDIEKRRFNPLISKFAEAESRGKSEKEFAAEYITPNLKICEVECQKAFELLGTEKYRTIIQNILYLGLANTRQNVLCGKKRGRKTRRAAVE